MPIEYISIFKLKINFPELMNLNRQHTEHSCRSKFIWNFRPIDVKWHLARVASHVLRPSKIDLMEYRTILPDDFIKWKFEHSHLHAMCVCVLGSALL